MSTVTTSDERESNRQSPIMSDHKVVLGHETGFRRVVLIQRELPTESWVVGQVVKNNVHRMEAPNQTKPGEFRGTNIPGSTAFSKARIEAVHKLVLLRCVFAHLVSTWTAEWAILRV